MSDFITESDPITQHDWTPGHTEHTPTVSERIWEVQLAAADKLEYCKADNAERDVFIELTQLTTLAATSKLGEAVCHLQKAVEICNTYQVYIKGLDEITAELEKALDEQESERPDYYPGVA